MSLVAQPCPTLCDPIDCSLPSSFVHGDSPGKSTGVAYSIVIQLSIYIYSFFFFFRFFPPIHGFSHRSESPEPHVRSPSLGVWGWEKEPPRASGFEGQQGLSAAAPQDWGNKFHSRQRTKFHVRWDPARAVTPLEPESGLSADLEGLLGRWGRLWLSVGARTLCGQGHCGDKDSGGQGTRGN